LPGLGAEVQDTETIGSSIPGHDLIASGSTAASTADDATKPTDDDTLATSLTACAADWW
jgi:hypothetical protein